MFLPINEALKQARKSEHRHRIGAVIFSKKSIISSACNYPSRSAKSVTAKYLKREDSLHAEVMAIIRARRNLNNLSMLVVRINAKGKLMMAKPCEYCMSYIEYVGIKTIYFSDENGNISRIKL